MANSERQGLVQAQVQSANVSWQQTRIGKAERARNLAQWPMVLWLTGLSGAGKSTIADRLEQEIQSFGKHTYLLDGDNLRHGLNSNLGFSLEDRVENVRRAAETAKLMVDAGLIVIVALISPLRSQRDAARALVADREFVEIFVDAPLDVCEARDPKGLYAKARRGELPDFTGIDSPYEAPYQPEVQVNTSELTVKEAVAEILDWLGKHAPRLESTADTANQPDETPEGEPIAKAATAEDQPESRKPVTKAPAGNRKRNDKFIISNTARSGSSMLSTLLDSHPRVLCHGEILAAPNESAGPYHALRKQGAAIDDWLRDYREERPGAFLYDVGFNPAGNQCVGFKFKLEELLLPQYQVFRDLIIADKDIKVLHLRRANILDQYISLQATKQSGVFSIRFNRQRPKLKPFRVRIPDLLDYLREDRRRHEAARALYRDHRSIELTYEELCGDQPATLARVQDFLEVPKADLATMMIKVLPKNTDLVLNLDEVREVLAVEGIVAES